MFFLKLFLFHIFLIVIHCFFSQGKENAHENKQKVQKTFPQQVSAFW
jgi:hypothetical protein